MPFDVDRFQMEKWAFRESEVDVKDLAKWFSDDDNPQWKVRNLTGAEVQKAKFAKERNLRIKASIEKSAEILSIKNEKKLKDAIGGLFGNLEAEADTAWRIELFVSGSVEPRADYPLASKILEVRPTDFLNITNEIIRLTGLGHEPGKQTPSGETKGSKRP